MEERELRGHDTFVDTFSSVIQFALVTRSNLLTASDGIVSMVIDDRRCLSY